MGWLELTGQAGYRFGDSYDVTPDSRRWAAGTAVVWITNRVAAVMGGGRVPANPSRGLPARNYANFGMMLSYNSIPRTTVPVAPRTLAAVRDFEVRPLATGTQKITVRVGGVETVEVMGDFSDPYAVPIGPDAQFLVFGCVGSTVRAHNDIVEFMEWVDRGGDIGDLDVILRVVVPDVEDILVRPWCYYC